MTVIKADKFRQVFDRVAWSAITVIAMYSASMLKDLSKTVQAMSTNLAVMANQVLVQDARQKEFDARLEKYAEQIRTLEISSASRTRRIRSVSVYGE